MYILAERATLQSHSFCRVDDPENDPENEGFLLFFFTHELMLLSLGLPNYLSPEPSLALIQD